MSTPSLDRSTPLPPSPHNLYASLTAYLNLHASQTLEVEILPSSFPLPPNTSPPFLTDNLSLALPKKALIEAFITARRIFFSPDATTTARYEATRTLLIFDPEYLTAANARKRWLLDSKTTNGGCSGDEELFQAVIQELAFVSSLLTSPLNRHNKSPTLWHHRYWVLRTFLPRLITRNNRAGPDELRPDTNVVDVGAIKSLWLSELTIITRAGDRHSRNYYAWD
ncbi:hypothetical protein MMC08_001704 [Hypocenomyce scalaris]|nr:hypothetical protein [Hypocenomyce scalaris]